MATYLFSQWQQNRDKIGKKVGKKVRKKSRKSREKSWEKSREKFREKDDKIMGGKWRKSREKNPTHYSQNQTHYCHGTNRFASIRFNMVEENEKGRTGLHMGGQD